VDLGGGGTAYYVYDGAGQRVRKVIERQGSLTEERIYLGGFEVFRRRTSGGGPRFERQTLHVMDGQRRIAMVETKTLEDGAPVNPPETVIRYQLDNHLGSAIVELDGAGLLLSYEEYYPYGETSYHSARGAAETSVKRHRYTGKERDDETRLYYYGARYYIPWLGRWASADPAGVADDVNVYAYVRNNPVVHSDPTGMLSWRTVAVVAAVVVVGTVITVATAGVAAPLVAGAVASIGLSGAAATVATGVAGAAPARRRGQRTPVRSAVVRRSVAGASPWQPALVRSWAGRLEAQARHCQAEFWVQLAGPCPAEHPAWRSASLLQPFGTRPPPRHGESRRPREVSRRSREPLAERP
jgi:RHS repeat-associated protein